MKRAQIEFKILNILGSYPRIVQSKGIGKDGLFLGFAPNGNLREYLTAHPETSLEQRLTCCIQATEALAYIHSKCVLHCDIRHDNLLLDANLDLKLADFQCQHLSSNGEIFLGGLSLESTKVYLPHKPADHASIKIDLFALGGAIYFTMLNHEVFPDPTKSENEIERRSRAREFSTDSHVCSAIAEKCWTQFYSSGRQGLADLEAVRDAIACGETPDSITQNVVPMPEKKVAQ